MEDSITILAPIDGDMLNERDGKIVDGCLHIKVKVLALPGGKVAINNIQAIYANGEYLAEIPLRDYSNVIRVQHEDSGCSQCITVYWLRHYVGKYRLSLDDNIWFLQDIANHAQQYRSIFENPYLGFLKQVHDKYGTKVHINIFYQTEGFALSQMPAKYKGEWQENAQWLRLSFHALQNEPDKPYLNAGYEQVRRDCEMVLEQIKRFAGEELAGPVTTLHWGTATVNGCKALRDCGYLCQVGYFNVDDDLPPVSYYLDEEKRRHMKRRSIWKDNKEGIIFCRSAIVLDRHGQEMIPVFLDEFRSDPQRACFIDLLIHEQYFYPHYIAYQTDYRQKVLSAVRWADEMGYQPGFLGECVLN